MIRKLAPIGLCILALLATWFFVRNIMHQQPAPARDQYRDSIRTSLDKAEQFRDSATHYSSQVTYYESKMDALNRLDSLRMADMRASYRADWIQRNGNQVSTGSTGLSDSIRIPEADHHRP